MNDTPPALRCGASRRELLFSGLLLLLCAGAFQAVPQLDLAAAAYFYDPVRGFAGANDSWVQALYRGIPQASRLLIVALVLGGIVSLVLQRQRPALRHWCWTCLLALALGQGLLIDNLLKDGWGRARPNQLAQFGGSAEFSPVLQPSTACQSNCSFVSGHAGAGFFLLSLGWTLRPTMRRRWLVTGICAGLGFGLARISQGGHFPSDVLFAGFASYYSTALACALSRGLGRLGPQPDGN